MRYCHNFYCILNVNGHINFIEGREQLYDRKLCTPGLDYGLDMDGHSVHPLIITERLRLSIKDC